MVIRKIKWSPRAKLDLFEILNFYYKRNGTITYSRKLNKKVRNSIKLLAKHPYIGIHTDVQDIRNLVGGDYSVFYEIQSDSIDILSIWDNRQDPDKLDLLD